MKIFSKTDDGKGPALSTFPHYGLGFGFAGTRLCEAGGAVQCHWLGPMGQLCLGSGTKGPGGELQAWQLFLCFLGSPVLPGDGMVVTEFGPWWS